MDEANALWIPSNNYFPRRSGHSPRWIIIHGTAGFGSAEEVAAAVSFLCSPEAGYITGQILCVDGGMAIHI